MNRLPLTLALILSVSGTCALAKDEPSDAFLKKAIQGNLAETQMGQLAQKSGQSEDVKSFGKMLSDDHAAANQKATDAAGKLGMTAPTEPSARQKALYEKMSKMTGAQFDRSFAKDMVEDHEKDLADYKKEARQNDAAGQYAAGEIDTLQKHLDTAKDTAKALRTHKSASK
jgi:predicted outer membrane protein